MIKILQFGVLVKQQSLLNQKCYFQYVMVLHLAEASVVKGRFGKSLRTFSKIALR